MLSGKSRILCLFLSAVIMSSFAAIPSYASVNALVGCSGTSQNPNSGTPAAPVYDYTDVNSYNFYFGQLNSHSNQSDGNTSIDNAFLHARDVAKLDFFAITDNSDYFDNGPNATLGTTNSSSRWITGRAAAEYYSNSKFVGIYGFEMAWSNKNGHIDTFNTEGFETSTEASYSGTNGLYNYYNTLKQYPASLSQFNHPGTTYGDFADFGYYDSQIDARIALIEVGNGEGTPGGNQYFPSYSYYTRALDKGWHLAPTNNQDNRKNLFGDANNCRTVILAKSLSKTEIMNAIKNMRVYATEDKDLRIRYSLNGQIMGSVLNTRQNSVNIRVDMNEPDGEAIGTVSVIANGGKVVQSQTLAVSSYSLNLNLPADYSYYYIRVDQSDKDVAVTAPVWIVPGGNSDGGGNGNISTYTGISRTYFSTDAPKKGEPLKITTEVFNNETTDMTVTGVAFLANDKIIKTLDSAVAVKPGTTGKFSVDYTPSNAGKIEIDVIVKAKIQNIERIFADTKTMNPDNPHKPDKNDDSVKSVIDLINKIKFHGYKLSTDAVTAARNAYNLLTADQKKLVSNYDMLLAAEQWVQWVDKWGKYWGHSHGKKK